jgi:SIR2-like domain
LITVVLGAGATRGASFVGDLAATVLPPLDADFFEQLQRIHGPLNQRAISRVLDDISRLFNIGATPTLERMFTTLEHTLKIQEASNKEGDISHDDLSRMRRRLMEAMALVFRWSLTDDEGRHQSCRFHQSIVENLTSEDRILSFNYDCLIDHTLRGFGSGKWNAQVGYGFEVSNAAKWNADDASPLRTIRLYKLHGSLHFRRAISGVSLRSEPYEPLKGKSIALIPPEWNKTLTDKPFGGVWRKASIALRNATTVVVIGYSFPATDMHAEALFRISSGQRALRNLVVVNPSVDARRRTREVLFRRLAPTTRVLEFNSLEQFAGHDGWTAWRRDVDDG